MVWQIHLKHETIFEYTFDVLASFNEARMSPAIKQGQNVISHTLKVDPQPTYYSYFDYFGTKVTAFDIHAAHKKLEIFSDSIVETSDREISIPDLTWTDLDNPNIEDVFYEYLIETPLTNLHTAEFDEIDSPTPHDFVEEITQKLKEIIAYSPGATTVASTAYDAWAAKAGVCQDFSHIMISVLRDRGIPARYISGYLYTGNGEIGEEVVGESHSWVEAWLGDWLAFDPTNGKPVGKEHIFVAYGRDYHDVSPLRGIFTGGQGKNSHVKVTLEIISS